MRPTKGELRLAASSVRIARRRIQEYHHGESVYMFCEGDVLERIDQLLRRAEEALGSEDIAPSI